MPRASKGKQMRLMLLEKARDAAVEKRRSRRVDAALYSLAALPSDTETAASTSFEAPIIVPEEILTSAEQRKKFTYRKKDIQISGSEYILIRKDNIEDICKKFSCGQCHKKKLKCDFVAHQADTTVNITCVHCNAKLYNNADDHKVKKVKNIHVVTMMMCYLTMSLGYGYAGIEKLCALLNMRHFGGASYLRYARIVTKKAVQKAKEVLETNRESVNQYYKETLGRVPDDKGILDVDVTFDWSWHTKGDKSLLGTGAVIDANTGLVLDYENLSKICMQCNVKDSNLKKKKITLEEYVQWKEGHDPSCDNNYTGTSGGMEPEAASRMWRRSLQHSMRYRTFVSDKDISSYIALKELDNGEGPYGLGYEVQREGCVCHVSNRLGNDLRNLSKKLSCVVVEGRTKRRKTTIVGCYILTDDVIGWLQRCFDDAVRWNAKASIDEMRDNIMSSFNHCLSIDAYSKHHLCPKSADSWCFYQKSIARGGEDWNYYENVPLHFELEPDQLRQVQAVYAKLTTDNMMLNCLRGWTLNPNESLHARIWTYCPKHKNATKPKLDFAVAQAISNHSSGHVEGSLNEILGIPYTSCLDKYLKTLDRMMDKPVAKIRLKKAPKAENL